MEYSTIQNQTIKPAHDDSASTPEYKGPQKSPKHNKKLARNFYYTITMLFGILFVLFKILTIGWYSAIAFIPLLLYLLFYISFGFKFADLPEKSKSDYIFFWLASLFLLLSGLLFVDFGDYGPPHQIITFIPYSLSFKLSIVTACITILLIVFFHSNHKTKKFFF